MKNALILLICILSFSTSHAQEEWVLKKDKENIQVYVKKVEGFNMKAYKGVTELETSLNSLVALLMDVPGFMNWMPKAKEVKVLKKKGEAEIIYYVLTEAPWPVNDRDGIYTFKAQRDLETGGVLIQTGCHPEDIPERAGVVRIKYSKGFWKLIPLNNGRIRVIYQNHSEPGGNIPAWLTNSSVVEVPFSTLQKIKEQIQQKKYQNKQFDFLR